MSELAGFIFYVVKTDTEREYVDSDILEILRPENVELNTYLFFDRLMKVKMREFYRFEEKTIIKKKEIPINRKSAVIFRKLLKVVDDKLYEHLESLKFQPIITCLKWIRLIFLREFDFKQNVLMWDFIIKNINFKTEIYDFKNHKVCKDENSMILHFDIFDFICVAFYEKQRENLMQENTEVGIVQVLQETLICSVFDILIIVQNLIGNFIRTIFQNC